MTSSFIFSEALRAHTKNFIDLRCCIHNDSGWNAFCMCWWTFTIRNICIELTLMLFSVFQSTAPLDVAVITSRSLSCASVCLILSSCLTINIFKQWRCASPSFSLCTVSRDAFIRPEKRIICNWYSRLQSLSNLCMNPVLWLPLCVCVWSSLLLMLNLDAPQCSLDVCCSPWLPALFPFLWSWSALISLRSEKAIGEVNDVLL